MREPARSTIQVAITEAGDRPNHSYVEDEHTDSIGLGSTGLEGSAQASLRTSRLGVSCAFCVVIGALAMTLVMPGPVAKLFPLVVCAVAITLLAKGSSPEYLEFVLWIWLLVPELRRLIDYRVGWTPLSPVMLAPPLASLLCLLPALRSRRRIHPDAATALVVVFVALIYGFLVGVVKVGLEGSGASLATWLGPLAVGLYVATVPPDTEQLRAILRRVAAWGALLLGVYGVVQFLALPAWDAYWIENAPISSIGEPVPLKLRVFSTLNSPGPFAMVMGCLLIVLTGVRTPLRWFASVVGFAAFALSLVRISWLAFMVCVLALLLRKKGQRWGAALLLVVVPIILLVTVEGPVKEAVTTRFEDTVKEGRDDESLSARIEFRQRVAPAVARDLVGAGLGSVGVTTRVSDAKGLAAEQGDFDAGELEVLFVFGMAVGVAVLVVIVNMVVAAFRRSRAGSDLDAACGAALIGILVQLAAANTLSGVVAVFFWVLAGFLARDFSNGSEPAASRRWAET